MPKKLHDVSAGGFVWPLEQEIIAEAARRARLHPEGCPVGQYAAAILAKDLEKMHVEIEAHECRGSPVCPPILARVLE